jgi:hypothetical protein
MIDRKRLREGRLKISSELAKTNQPVDQVVEAEVEIIEDYRKRGKIRHFEIYADEQKRGHGGTDTAPGPLEYFLLGAAF